MGCPAWDRPYRPHPKRQGTGLPSYPAKDAAGTNQARQLSWYEAAAAAQIHKEQLPRVDLFNGRAAMLGFVIGVITEAHTGQGSLHQDGLGTLLSQS